MSGIFSNWLKIREAYDDAEDDPAELSFNKKPLYANHIKHKFLTRNYGNDQEFNDLAIDAGLSPSDMRFDKEDPSGVLPNPAIPRKPLQITKNLTPIPRKVQPHPEIANPQTSTFSQQKNSRRIGSERPKISNSFLDFLDEDPT